MSPLTEWSGGRGSRSEREDNGDLIDFLDREFLGSYYNRIEPRFAQIRQIGGPLSTVLSRIVGHPSVREARITGSLARCLATGVPKDYWTFAFSLQDALGLPGFPQNPELGAISAHFLRDPDLDVKLTLANGETLAGLAQAVNQIDLPDFTVDTSVRPVPTNPRRETMLVEIRDGADRERLMHLDVGLLPENVAAAYTDKRSGVTADKQDFCYAPLSVENGRTHYALGPSAREVMKKPDVIATETTDLNDYLEILLRSYWTSLMFGPNKRPDLLFRSPPWSPESFLAIREKVLRFTREPETPVVSQMNKALFGLCLAYNPFHTLQMARHTMLAKFIPAFAQFSAEDWYRFFTNPGLYDLSQGVRPRVLTTRTGTINAMDAQMMTNSRLGLFDGVERIVRTLMPDRSNGWSAYPALWEPRSATVLHAGTASSESETADDICAILATAPTLLTITEMRVLGFDPQDSLHQTAFRLLRTGRKVHCEHEYLPDTTGRAPDHPVDMFEPGWPFEPSIETALRKLSSGIHIPDRISFIGLMEYYLYYQHIFDNPPSSETCQNALSKLFKLGDKLGIQTIEQLEQFTDDELAGETVNVAKGKTPRHISLRHLREAVRLYFSDLYDQRSHDPKHRALIESHLPQAYGDYRLLMGPFSWSLKDTRHNMIDYLCTYAPRSFGKKPEHPLEILFLTWPVLFRKYGY